MPNIDTHNRRFQAIATNFRGEGDRGRGDEGRASGNHRGTDGWAALRWLESIRSPGIPGVPRPRRRNTRAGVRPEDERDGGSGRSGSLGEGRSGMKAAIYARYSSEACSPTSIPDQIASCRRLAAKRGIEVLEDHIYHDDAI